MLLFRYMLLQCFRNIFTGVFQLAAAVRTFFLLRQGTLHVVRGRCAGSGNLRAFRRLIHNWGSRRNGGSCSHLLARLASSSSSRSSNCSICRSNFSDLRPNSIRHSLAISSFSRSYVSSSLRPVARFSEGVVRPWKEFVRAVRRSKGFQCFVV